MTEIRDVDRQRYAAAALEMARSEGACCGPGCCETDVSRDNAPVPFEGEIASAAVRVIGPAVQAVTR